ncbi:MAG: MerR family transcriptional regulator [Bacteroidota bacterium]|nr:MerR family transcriptional regulator [Bacteroidota bacterium]
MTRYSIRNLEQISGIKTHTIRMWEKRYHILSPSRTKTNIRYYTDEDLKRLLNICSLLRSGLRISQIAKLCTEEFRARLLTIADEGKKEDQLTPFLTSLFNYNIEEFRNLLDLKIMAADSSDFIEQIAYPLFLKINLLWMSNNLSDTQRNIAYSILREKLYGLINLFGSTTTVNQNIRVICFLPETEYDETEMLFYILLLRKYELSPIYIGQLSDTKVLHPLPHKDNILLSGFSIPTSSSLLSVYAQKLSELDVKSVFIYHHNLQNEVSSFHSKKVKFITSPSQFQKILNRSIKDQ